MSNLTRYRVWPDGTVQEADIPAHHWKSDDYELVEALNTEDAWGRAKANAPAVPQGWRFKRNADDSIGIFAPPPKPGESQRTSHAVYPGQNRDLHELLGKLADQQAATPAPAPAQESAITGEADVWHEGSKSFYRAALRRILEKGANQMSATEQKHTTGPRRRTPAPWLSKEIAWQYDGSHALMWCDKSKGGEHWRRLDEQCNGRFSAPDARLLAAAPELLEVLHECIDAQWVIDSHAVEFDGTVHFGPYYDFSGLDGIDRHEFLAEHSCVVWPSGGKWSAYCAYEGSTWFEAFDRADAAKEACMKLLDKVMPTHPAMKARAAIAKATGATND